VLIPALGSYSASLSGWDEEEVPKDVEPSHDIEEETDIEVQPL